jgi:hypothetical protein
LFRNLQQQKAEEEKELSDELGKKKTTTHLKKCNLIPSELEREGRGRIGCLDSNEVDKSAKGNGKRTMKIEKTKKKGSEGTNQNFFALQWKWSLDTLLFPSKGEKFSQTSSC